MAVPSILAANTVYCVSLAVALLIGAPLQRWNPSAGLMAAETLLIVPALLAAPRPRRASLRWRWPEWRVCALSAVLGAAIWPLAAFLSALSALVSGPGGMETASLSLTLVLAMTVFPAFCEELLFRGYIQTAYERRGARAGILVPALLFVGFHVPARRFVELIPVALVLGYLAWGTQSVIPGIFAHFALNSLSAFWAWAIAAGLMSAYPLLPALGIAVAISPLVAAGALWALQDAVDRNRGS